MKKLISVFLLVFISQIIFASWNINPFEYKVFIENKGQFNNIGSNIIYGTQNNGTQLFFTATGFIYKMDTIIGNKEIIEELDKEKKVRNSQAFKEETEEEIIKEHQLAFKAYSVKSALVTMEWLGANKNAKIIALDSVSEYFNYAIDSSQYVSYARAYKTILYKNLYDGIDVEYFFHPVAGIKYNIILHPGADASQIKMQYNGAEKISLENISNNLVIHTDLRSITDNAPISYHSASKQAISSAFVLEDNIVSINLGSYNNASEVTIDPWLLDPGWGTSVPNQNRVFDVAIDQVNDIYIYGSQLDHKIRKLGPLGNPIWTTNVFNAVGSFAYGDLYVEKNGESYASTSTMGATGASSNFKKLDANGIIQWQSAGGEPFCVFMDNTENDVFTCGTGTPQTSYYDKSSGALLNFVNISNGLGEIRSLTRGQDGNFYGISCFGGAMNKSSQILAFKPDRAMIYRSRSCYLQDSMFSYVPSLGIKDFDGHSLNAITTSCKYIYTTNGLLLCKYNINDGSNVVSVPIVNGRNGWNAGVMVDSCENIYVGTLTGINKYDKDLNFISSIVTPGAVYDLRVGQNQEIIACGNGFVGSFGGMLSICGVKPITASVNITHATACNVYDAIANVSISGGFPPYQYSWSNGKTDVSVDSLKIGDYSVTISDKISCEPITVPFSVTPINAPVVSFSYSDSVICDYPECIDFNNTSPNMVNCKWTIGNTVQYTNCAFNHCFDSVGLYSVLLEVDDGTVLCAASLSKNNLIIVNPSPKANFLILNPYSIDPSIYFIDSTIGATFVKWNFGDSLGVTDSSEIKKTIHLYPTFGTYSVTLLAKNQFNCVDSLIKYVFIEKGLSISVPNSFTPNNDGVNDTFSPKFPELDIVYQMNIFDRWGNLIFTSKDGNTEWDGTYNNTNAPIDVYTYVISFSNTKVVHGIVSLLR